MNYLEKLTKEEMEFLLRAPILVSIYALGKGHGISKEEKAYAIKLAHTKTFTADPILLSYYNEVEKNFKNHFEEILKKYTPFDEAKYEALKKEITGLNKVIAKLDKPFAEILHKSLSGYAERVKKANRSVLEAFIFPIPIHGLTD